ncbi:hypothetical protein BHE74_00055239, partial [Ensete ventricosum]
IIGSRGSVRRTTTWVVVEQENPTPLQLADKRSTSSGVGDAAACGVNATGASATGVGRSASFASEMGVGVGLGPWIMRSIISY